MSNRFSHSITFPDSKGRGTLMCFAGWCDILCYQCKYRLHRGLHTQTCNHTILQLTIQLQQRGYHVSLITYLCIDYNVYACMECSLFTLPTTYTSTFYSGWSHDPITSYFSYVNYLMFLSTSIIFKRNTLICFLSNMLRNDCGFEFTDFWPIF